jgi:hypothetical protein
MKTHSYQLLGVALVATALGCAACQSPHRGLTNPNHPGPATGRAVGAGVGLTAGNVAGVVVGAGEGLAAGIGAPFTPPPQTTVQDYRTVVGPDGQVARVPIEIKVDNYGRPMSYPPSLATAAGNPPAEAPSPK